MTRSFAIVWLLIVALVRVSAAAEPRTLELEMKFPAPHFVTGDGERYEPQIDGLPNTVSGGLPSVPVRTFRIALPWGYELSGAELQEGSHLAFEMPIAMARAARPLSWASEKDVPRGTVLTTAPTIRTSTYPPARYEISVQKLHGVPVAIISFYPVLVMKDARHADALESATLRLKLTPSVARESVRLLPHQAREVADVADNAAIVSEYPVQRETRSAPYEYLIVATPTIAAYTGANGIKDLQAALEAKGLHSRVVTTQEIETQSTGADLIEKIREYVRKEYRDSGIQYVLLAGESRSSQAQAIPSRKMWSKIRAYMAGHWMDIEEKIAADLYYGCLDGTFNGNGNDKWGEADDGESHGDVDFLPEVTVGRVALRTTTDLQNFVKKTVEVSRQRLAAKALLLGEELFKELNLYGGDYMDQLVGESSDHGFTTHGFNADWSIEKLYDTASGQGWTGQQALQAMNAKGFGMVHHLGHSNTSINMKLSTSSIASFKNPAPFFYYTQGCFAGSFTQGSIVDRLVAAPYGAVAAVANTSYGLAPEDPSPSLTKTPGASQMFHRQFVGALFETTNRSLGRAHQDSRVALLGQKAAQEVRWVSWAANYLGDPSLTLRSAH